MAKGKYAKSSFRLVAAECPESVKPNLIARISTDRVSPPRARSRALDAVAGGVAAAARAGIDGGEFGPRLNGLLPRSAGIRGNARSRDFLEIASILHPKHGPFHPRRPDTMMERMIRGMLPRKKPSGLAAHKRLRTHIGVPDSVRSLKKIRIPKAQIRRAAPRYTSMADLGRTIGWTE